MQHAIRQQSLLDAFTVARDAHDRRARGESTLALGREHLGRTGRRARRRPAQGAPGELEPGFARAVAAELRRVR